MLVIEISCSMCGRIHPKKLDADTVSNLEPKRVKENIRKLFRGTTWQLQVNGEYFDTYCSSNCAR